MRESARTSERKWKWGGAEKRERKREREREMGRKEKERGTGGGGVGGWESAREETWTGKEAANKDSWAEHNEVKKKVKKILNYNKNLDE